MKISKPLLVGVAVVLLALFFGGAKWYRSQQAATTAQAIQTESAPLVRPYSPTLGAASAPVTIVEFFDPECESCRAMYPIVKEVLKEFDGRARLVIRPRASRVTTRSPTATSSARRTTERPSSRVVRL